MSHKDYVKIAGALAEARTRAVDPIEIEGIALAIGAIGAVLAEDNPRFDFKRFAAAAIGQPLTGRDRARS